MEDQFNRSDTNPSFSIEDAERILSAAEETDAEAPETDVPEEEVPVSEPEQAEEEPVREEPRKLTAEEAAALRERRRAKIKDMKRRRMIAYALMALILIVLITGISLIVKAIKNSRKPDNFAQIGPMPQETVTVESLKDPYNFSKEVPAGEDAGNEWFSDALIIGETRISGVEIYGLAPGADLYYSSSMTAESAKEGSGYDRNENSTSLSAVLAGKQYGKIYICLGLNEMGWNHINEFEGSLGSLVDMVKQAQPNADIYLQTVLPVTASLASSHSYITLERIASMNSMIQSVAMSRNVFFLGLPEELTMEDGSLNTQYDAGNGLSLNQNGLNLWCTYLRTHAVKEGDYRW